MRYTAVKLHRVSIERAGRASTFPESTLDRTEINPMRTRRGSEGNAILKLPMTIPTPDIAGFYEMQGRCHPTSRDLPHCCLRPQGLDA